MTDIKELLKALRSTGEGCRCFASCSSECCCDAVWGEDYTRAAADVIEMLLAEKAKLQPEVEMPEYKYIDRHDVPKEGMCVYTQDQLQTVAAQARMKALEEAKGVCLELAEMNRLSPIESMWQWEECAAAIESLKGKP